MRKLVPILLFVACSTASTEITDVYRDPSLTQMRFNKVAAMALVQDPAVIREAEDEMVRQIGPKAVAAYTILSPEDEKNAATVRAKLQSLGIDGAVTMALLSYREEPMQLRGIASGGNGFDMYYRPAAVGADAWNKVARVETKIFSVSDGKEIWSAATRTFDPSTAKQVVQQVADAVKNELRKDHLIQ